MNEFIKNLLGKVTGVLHIVWVESGFPINKHFYTEVWKLLNDKEVKAYRSRLWISRREAMGDYREKILTSEFEVQKARLDLREQWLKDNGATLDFEKKVIVVEEELDVFKISFYLFVKGKNLKEVLPK